MDNDTVTTESLEPAIPQVRPWIRLFARQVDFIAAIFVFVPVSLLIPAVSSLPDWLFGAAVLLVWVLAEAALLSTVGSTPGKWLLSIRVRDADGAKPTFSDALHRSGMVFAYGLGFGLPLVSLVTQYSSYLRLVSEGNTSWDDATGLVVSHHKAGPMKAVAAVIFALCVGLLIWLSVQSVGV